MNIDHKYAHAAIGDGWTVTGPGLEVLSGLALTQLEALAASWASSLNVAYHTGYRVANEDRRASVLKTLKG